MNYANNILETIGNTPLVKLNVLTKDLPCLVLSKYETFNPGNSVKDRMLKRDVIKEGQVVTIYKSQTFPTTGFGHVYNLKPELAAKVKESFSTFPWDNADGTPSSLKVEFSKSKEGQFIPITYQKEWDVIRKIDAANGVSYSCS